MQLLVLTGLDWPVTMGENVTLLEFFVDAKKARRKGGRQARNVRQNEGRKPASLLALLVTL